jgi:oxygen-independent coproporphyrinogen III oxidase
MPVGIYLSVPFCRTKCSYCNFASDVFSRSAYENYVVRILEDVANARQSALGLSCIVDENADTIYLGGGTPSILESSQLGRIFTALRENFAVTPDAEITVECAPGTLAPAMIETLLQCGVNRVSLGVQSFIDQEAQAVGRMHKRSTVLEEIDRLREYGLENINIDLIAGLPRQTAESWAYSVSEAIAAGVPHASVYMLEVDEDSRLGREVMAGGTRYHAHFVPDDEATTDFYEAACKQFEAAGVAQYEISNFARRGFESRHNLKYWTRQPYLGFGVDAHSMLVRSESEAVRFATADTLEKYVAGSPLTKTQVLREAEMEESFFLGLRLNQGVNLRDIADKFGCEAVAQVFPTIKQLESDGLLTADANVIRLTPRGRLLSNEVFEAFLAPEALNQGNAEAK